MTDAQILGWTIAIIAFIAGYGLGHLRGQCAGIEWCTKSDKLLIDLVEAARRSQRNTCSTTPSKGD